MVARHQKKSLLLLLFVEILRTCVVVALGKSLLMQDQSWIQPVNVTQAIVVTRVVVLSYSFAGVRCDLDGIVLIAS